jgi:nucleoside-diphosphate-sugar epimerase
VNSVPERVLITGAGGFIGSHLVEGQIARGRSVVATDVDVTRLTDLTLGDRLRIAKVDVRSRDEMRALLKDVDIVLHLAAAHLDVLRGADYFDEVNVRATADLAEMAHEAGARRFVHCSSVSVHGPLKTLPANEDAPCNPEIAYEQSKLDAERNLREVAARTGLQIVIVRPAWVYGPRCPRTRKLVQAIARRRFFFVGGGTNLRHPIYVSDLVEAFERAAVTELPMSETLIVAGPEVVTVRELVETIADEIGLDARIPTFPKSMVYAGCLAMESVGRLMRREPPFSRRSIKFFTESASFDTARARRVIGFEPRVALRDGIRATIDYCRDHGGL